jgi:hypothetical protein
VESAREWTTVSNEVGIFTISPRSPGPYTVSVEANGFKRITTNTIRLEVNQMARVDLTLEVGAVATMSSSTRAVPGTTTWAAIYRSITSIPH